MMENSFKSILKDEFISFMKFIALSVVDYKAYFYTLSGLDAFLNDEHLNVKKLDAQQIARWLNSFDVSLSTKKGKLSHIKRFSVYLSTLDVPSSLPELPRGTVDFKPYVFSTNEIAQIFDIADDYILTNPKARIRAEFPLLLRILYGCGLRLGEAVSLTWNDINLNEGIITIKIAKNQKQRIVPMSSELTRILSLYKKTSCFGVKDSCYLFIKNNGQCRSNVSYGNLFNEILYELGIKNPQTVKRNSRGPCLHSLRHTFAFHSLLKAESEGRSFMETVPFLSTYLGHAGLMETDKYLKASHELYTESHTVIANYTQDVFPKEV